MPVEEQRQAQGHAGAWPERGSDARPGAPPAAHTAAGKSRSVATRYRSRPGAAGVSLQLQARSARPPLRRGDQSVDIGAFSRAQAAPPPRGGQQGSGPTCCEWEGGTLRLEDGHRSNGGNLNAFLAHDNPKADRRATSGQHEDEQHRRTPRATARLAGRVSAGHARYRAAMRTNADKRLPMFLY
jgi:hypothetical protein